MTKREVYFFETHGAVNTGKVIQSVSKRVKDGDIESVVVASISGRTAIKLAENFLKENIKTRIICVSGPPSWEKYPEYEMPLIKAKERKRLKDLGVSVIDFIEEPFGTIIFRNWWEKKTLQISRPESDLFWMTLICVGGHGFRTAVEVVFMAAEAGEVRCGDKVIGVAGTGEGADSAIAMKATKFRDSVGPLPERRLKVEEILCMPKQTTWVGYG